MSIDENPYKAPAAPIAGSSRGFSLRTWMIAWTLVFAINQPIPAYFGWGVTNTMGKVGMVLAQAIVLGLGLWLLRGRARVVVKSATIGGVGVALSQFVPYLHIMAGLTGVSFAGLILGNTNGRANEVDSIAAGLITTLTTGGLLLIAAIALGGIILLGQFAFGGRGARTSSDPQMTS